MKPRQIQRILFWCVLVTFSVPLSAALIYWIKFVNRLVSQ